MAGEREYTAEDFARIRNARYRPDTLYPIGDVIIFAALRIAERVMTPGYMESIVSFMPGMANELRSALTKGGASD